MSVLAADQWPTISQAAERTQTSVQTIRRRIKDGTVDARRFGPRLLRVNPESLRNLGSPVNDRTEQYVQRLVAEAPNFSPEQRDRIAALLRPAGR